MKQMTKNLLDKLSMKNAARASLALQVGVMGLVADKAFAGTTGAEFQTLYTLVNGWSTGYLGRTIAIASFLVGAIVGFARSNAMPALIGIVFAILFSIGPGIIDGIASATI